MSQPIELSDELICDARSVGQISQRSITDQIEFWATLGRAVESTLYGDRALARRRAGTEQPLSELLVSVDSEDGRKRVCDYLDSRPYPHFESVADSPDLLCRIEGDGTQSVGKFVNREFIPID